MACDQRAHLLPAFSGVLEVELFLHGAVAVEDDHVVVRAGPVQAREVRLFMP
jgi:hypothetical protein